MNDRSYLEQTFPNDEYKKYLYFRDLFRNARETALKNAESFDEILFSLERLGLFLTQKPKQDLGSYRENIFRIARNSQLAKDIPRKWGEYHTSLSTLYNLVQDGRNDAMHQGAYARHLTEHAVQLALIIEDAFMIGKVKVSDYMVRNVIQTSLWQPLSFVRQQMLSNSFSYMPFLNDSKQWCLLSDISIATYINQGCEDKRHANLVKTVNEAILDNSLPKKLHVEQATTCLPSITIAEALKLMGKDSLKGKPLIVAEAIRTDRQEIIGIITAFDLL